MSYQQQGQQPTGYNGGYAPQQGYPPQQQQGYAPQQGYPPQQQGYAPQQQHIHVAVGNQASNDPDFLKAQAIFNSEFCGCLSDPLVCLCAFCFPQCQFGLNYEASGQGSCIVGCCCFCLLCCSSRSHIQRLARVPEDTCPIACLIHYFCHPCAVAQEGRAIKHLKAAHLRTPVM